MQKKHITNLMCWEIMNCDNRHCPARNEPETPCWEIAKSIGSFQGHSNTCRDCIVYIIKENNSLLSKEELQNITKNADQK